MDKLNFIKVLNVCISKNIKKVKIKLTNKAYIFHLFNEGLMFKILKKKTLRAKQCKFK